MIRRLRDRNLRKHLVRAQLYHAREVASYVGARALVERRDLPMYEGKIEPSVLGTLRIFADFKRQNIKRAWARIKELEIKLRQRERDTPERW